MEKLTYIVDIDGTICSITEGRYDLCEPFSERIEFLNTLYDNGHTIIYSTARGMGSSDGDPKEAISKYYAYTKKQLDNWGCRYSRLYLGKPKGDVYVDDKAVKDTDFFSDFTKNVSS